jgi:hypothetical protein
VLECGDLADAIIDAIRERHPSMELEDRASYVRVLVPSRCVLDRAAVERRIGRPFRLPLDLEQVMPSFKGRLKIDAEQAVWAVGDAGAAP